MENVRRGWLRNGLSLSLSLSLSIFVNFWHFPRALFGFGVIPVLAPTRSSIFFPWLICQSALESYQQCSKIAVQGKEYTPPLESLIPMVWSIGWLWFEHCSSKPCPRHSVPPPRELAVSVDFLGHSS
ncbi:hypothetical protein H106_03746 [Trichophyton rubrum CBS 735.88]|nr:hypothetical protein H106_03746 [Trichophyton rubrum CBS 735.88]